MHFVFSFPAQVYLQVYACEAARQEGILVGLGGEGGGGGGV